MPTPSLDTLVAQLSGSAKDALLQVATLLADDFTGEIRLVCAEGGVRDSQVVHSLKRANLDRRQALR